jgi:hypothetical protein
MKTMAEQFEFELVFGLPKGEYDPFELSDAVFEAGFEEAIVGTGNPRLLGVELESEGEDIETVILDAARAIIKCLPKGTELREVRPDLVSLADVAEKLAVSRQTLQKREMPLPVAGGLYRIDEVAAAISKADAPAKGKRKPRFDSGAAEKWFLGGSAARRLNAKIAMEVIDVRSLEVAKSQPKRARFRRKHA